MGGFLKNKNIAFILLLAFFLRIAVAVAPFSWLMERGILPDDAFYYFAIARNIADGFGVTFDRLAPTNGFHPLWMMVILPIFYLIESKIFAVRVVLFLSAIIGTASVLVLYKIIRNLRVSESVSWAGSFLFAISPAAFLSSAGGMNGLETGLNVFLILLYFFYYAKFFNGFPSDRILSKENIVFGIISGLLFLARTDNAILLLVSCGFLFVKFLKEKKPEDIKKMVIAAIVSGFIILPWLLWSYYTFGEIIQVSAKAVPFVIHEKLVATGWTYEAYFIRYLKNILDSFIYLFGLLVGSKLEPGFLLMAAGTLSLGIVFLSNLFKSKGRNEESIFFKRAILLFPFIVSFSLFIGVQTIRAVYLRPWYFFSVMPILFIIAICITDFMVSTSNPKTKKLCLIGGGILYGAAVFMSLFGFLRAPAFPGELGKYRLVNELNSALEENSIVGAWNAGVLGYFFEKGRIINLDGVVNNQALAYIKSHNLKGYARRIGIKYLADAESEFMTDYWGKIPPIKEMDVMVSFVDPRAGVLMAGRLR